MHIDTHILPLILLTPLVGAAPPGPAPRPRQDPAMGSPDRHPPHLPPHPAPPRLLRPGARHRRLPLRAGHPPGSRPPPFATTSASTLSACGSSSSPASSPRSASSPAGTPSPSAAKPSTSSSCSSKSPCSASSSRSISSSTTPSGKLSLVPMTILIATFGRTKNRRPAAIKYFVYAFLPSALLLVGMLWLYAKTGTFDVVRLTALAQAHANPRPPGRPLALLASPSCLPLPSRSPSSPSTAGSRTPSPKPPRPPSWSSPAKTGLYSILRFSFAIFPAQSHRIAPLMIALGAIGIVYGSLIALHPDRPQRARRLLHPRPSLLRHPRHLQLHPHGPRRRHLPDPQPRHLRRRALPPARLPLRALRNLRHSRVRRPRRTPPLDDHPRRHHLALARRPCPSSTASSASSSSSPAPPRPSSPTSRTTSGPSSPPPASSSPPPTCSP